MTRWSHFPEVVKTGGLTGQGFTNLLGRPRLSPMSLLLREAAQNAWDARERGVQGRGAPFSSGSRDAPLPLAPALRTRTVSLGSAPALGWISHHRRGR